MERTFKKIGLVVLGMLWVSCGPMNEDPSLSNGGLNSSRAGVSGGVALSKNNLFYVSPIPLSSGLDENGYRIRIASTQDLQPPSTSAKVTVTYRMPEMPQMGEDTAEATRQSDGSFTATLFFSMLGRWQINIHIQDGTKEDSYSFETLL